MDDDSPGPRTRTHLELRIAQGDVAHARRILRAIPDGALDADERLRLEERIEAIRGAPATPAVDPVEPTRVAARSGDLSAAFRDRLGGGRREQKVGRLRRLLRRLERTPGFGTLADPPDRRGKGDANGGTQGNP